ncbi:MAG: hypothetical protein KGD58_14585 [Candidatus Lokiarchaeota archaeon]|nr:hypothetical protein [Candidatus Lokiarchaeota archaeon]
MLIYLSLSTNKIKKNGELMFYKTIEKEKLKLSFTSYLRRKPELEEKQLEIQMALTKIVGKEDVVTDESQLLSYKYS